MEFWSTFDEEGSETIEGPNVIRICQGLFSRLIAASLNSE